MLKIGMFHEVTFPVTGELTARAVGSGTLEVLATPVMIAGMEKAAWTAVAGALPEGSSTVGTRMEVSHSSATPVGMTVTCRAELLEAEGRRLVFRVTASDEAGPIGEGTHERFLVQDERFLKKAREKRRPN